MQCLLDITARPFEALAVIQDDEVNIAGVVQLTRTELAHSNGEDAALTRRVEGVERRQLAGRRCLLEQMTERGRNGCIGKGRQRARHPLERPDIAQIGERHDQGNASPRDSKIARNYLAWCAEETGLTERVDDAAQAGCESAFGDRAEQGWLGKKRLTQEWRVAEQAVQQRAPGAVRRQGGAECPFATVTQLARAVRPLLETARRGLGIRWLREPLDICYEGQ